MLRNDSFLCLPPIFTLNLYLSILTILSKHKLLLMMNILVRKIYFKETTETPTTRGPSTTTRKIEETTPTRTSTTTTDATTAKPLNINIQQITHPIKVLHRQQLQQLRQQLHLNGQQQSGSILIGQILIQQLLIGPVVDLRRWCHQWLIATIFTTETDNTCKKNYETFTKCLQTLLNGLHEELEMWFSRINLKKATRSLKLLILRRWRTLSKLYLRRFKRRLSR